jgi:hypothetical protein
MTGCRPSPQVGVLPSGFLPSNENAVDWGGCGIACYATGSSIHFYFAGQSRCDYLYSTDYKPNHLTTIRFHGSHRFLAFGDTRGNVLLFDVQRRAIFGSAIRNTASNDVLDIQWQNDVFVVLYANKRLAAFRHSPDSNTDSLRRIALLWEIPLRERFTRLSFDPHGSGMFLLSGNDPLFAIYRWLVPTDAPNPFFESVELSCQESVHDVQWSYHFQGLIYVLLAREMVAFYIQSQTLIPLVAIRKTISPYMRLIQSREDHHSLMAIHKNGSISFFTATRAVDFCLNGEYLPKHSGCQIVRCASTSLTDNELFLVFSQVGAALFDVRAGAVVAATPTFPLSITAIDSDDTHLAYGTANGYVVLTTVLGHTGAQRYLVADRPVLFVGLSRAVNRIFFQCEDRLGEVNLEKRAVIRYPSRVSVSGFRCRSSRSGALIVQREPRCLGVFIDGRERPLLFDNDALDFAINTAVSGPSAGEFGVVLRSKMVLFFAYSAEGGVERRSLRFSLHATYDPVAFGFDGDELIIGFENGSLLCYNIPTKRSSSRQLSVTSVQTLQFHEGAIFGISGEDDLFHYSRSGQFCQCPYPVRAFSIVSPTVLFVLATDTIARVISVDDWRLVTRSQGGICLDGPVVTRVAAHPLSQTEFDIDSPAQIWFQPEARQIWMALRSDVPMLLRGHFAAGDSKQYDETVADINASVDLISKSFQQTRALADLFANRFEQAARGLVAEPTDGPADLVANGTLAALAITAGEVECEKLVLHLKSVAVALFLREEYEQGAIFLKIARLENLAAEYLLGYEQLDLALKFIRGLEGADKRRMLLRLGAKLLQGKKIFEALLTFVSCGEFQMVLWLMVEFGMVADAFFVKKYAGRMDWMHPANPDVAKLVPEMPELEELCARIDADFASWAGDIGVDPRDVKTLFQ